MQSIKQILPTAVLLVIIGLLAWATPVYASPSAPITVTLTQPDGTPFTAVQWGDEWNSGFESLEGYSILQTSDGWWVYARQQANGSLGPALPSEQTRRVGLIQPTGIPLHLRPEGISNSLLLLKRSSPAPAAEPEYVVPPASGDMKVLVLLAKFSDTNETYPASTFEQLVFGAGGSLASYYHEASYGNLNLIPAEETCGTVNDGVTDWTQLLYEHPNTGSSTSEANLQISKDVLVASDACIDFAIFDVNLDGFLSANELQIIVVVAGWEQAYGDYSAPSIWAHSFYLDFVETPTLDDVVIGSYYQQSYYAQIGEIHGTGMDQHPATLGVLAHEFGHLLNWPDLYDIDDSTEGVGRWSIMGSGGWNQTGTYAGDTPAHPDAWLKWYSGWLDPVEVTGTMVDVQIEQAEDHASAYLLRPNKNGIDWIFNYHSGRGEYFLVENRQQNLSDAGLPGCGLLIWHIQEQVTFNNYANSNENFPLIGLDQADGKNDLKLNTNRGDAGDPYPGDSTNIRFDMLSNPASRLLAGGVSGVSIEVDSSACGMVMQADLAYHLEKYTLLNIHKSDTSCSAWETILSEDFEDGSMDGWTTIDKNGLDHGEYLPAVSSCRAAGGTHSAWLIAGGADGSLLDCGAHYPDQAIPWMVYGPFSTLGESAMRLDFSHWTYIEPAIPYTIFDRQCVWGSEDNEEFIGYCFTGDWGGWYSYAFNLKDDQDFYDFLDKPKVWLAFSMMTDEFLHFPEGGFVDDITLNRCASAAGSTSQKSIPVIPGPNVSTMLSSITKLFQWPKPYTQPAIIGPIYLWQAGKD
jgi:M6 family metalloprotease-like protein